MWELRNGVLVNKILLEKNVISFFTTKLSPKTLFSNLSPVTAQQIHSKNIYLATQKDKGKEIKAVDGLLTFSPNTPLLIRTADCLPIYIFEKKKKLIGLIHAGRKGLENGIIENLIDKLNSIETNLNDLELFIGPHICSKCYFMDLEKELEKKLKNRIKKIYKSNYCTYHMENLFYSYRRGDKTERMKAVIILSMDTDFTKFPFSNLNYSPI